MVNIKQKSLKTSHYQVISALVANHFALKNSFRYGTIFSQNKRKEGEK
jgi:hypothetical protein